MRRRPGEMKLPGSGSNLIKWIGRIGALPRRQQTREDGRTMDRPIGSAHLDLRRLSREVRKLIEAQESEARPGSPRHHEKQALATTPPLEIGAARAGLLGELHIDAALMLAGATPYVDGVADCLEVAATRGSAVNFPALSVAARPVAEIAALVAWLMDDKIGGEERGRPADNTAGITTQLVLPDRGGPNTNTACSDGAPTQKEVVGSRPRNAPPTVAVNDRACTAGSSADTTGSAGDRPGPGCRQRRRAGTAFTRPARTSGAAKPTTNHPAAAPGSPSGPARP